MQIPCKSFVFVFVFVFGQLKRGKLTKKENGGDEGLIVIPLGLLSPLISKSVPPHFAKDNAQPFVCNICKCVICKQPCIRVMHSNFFI